ncbi:MAG: 4Fe-4S binding protein [Methanobacteriaceae archaeon]|jgi:NAD-dependent dihydropyrimidine dehydrogenase PreA subunit|nr:4Fe-4S binding protein [Methanobacteriaceae archaeon]
MANVSIDYDKCQGPSCAECVDTCPMSIFVVEGDKIGTENEEICSQCEICMDVCPTAAITVED